MTTTIEKDVRPRKPIQEEGETEDEDLQTLKNTGSFEKLGEERTTIHGYSKLVRCYLEIYGLYSDLSVQDIFSFFRSVATHAPLTDRDKEKLKKMPYSILVICHQNQGRSQVEEALIRMLMHLFESRVVVKSRGYEATPDKYDKQKPNPFVRQTMKKIGIPLKRNAVVKQLLPTDVNSKTLILILDESMPLYDWLFKAKAVVKASMQDAFPGSKQPTQESQLEYLVMEAAYICNEFVLVLIESVLENDFSIFTRFFQKQIIKPQSIGETQYVQTQQTYQSP